MRRSVEVRESDDDEYKKGFELRTEFLLEVGDED